VPCTSAEEPEHLREATVTQVYKSLYIFTLVAAQLVPSVRASPTPDAGASVRSSGTLVIYALATCSCEGANSVDACTVAALDVTASHDSPTIKLGSGVSFRRERRKDAQIAKISLACSSPKRSDSPLFSTASRVKFIRGLLGSTKANDRVRPRLRMYSELLECSTRHSH
jgi:hypothetical protein